MASSELTERPGPGCDNEVLLYLHCGLCMEELPVGVSPSDWQQLEVGWTKPGLQVWCKRP